jgi:hypothetical protein
VAYSGLGGEVDHTLWFVFLEGLFHCFAIRYVYVQVRVVLVVGVTV